MKLNKTQKSDVCLIKGVSMNPEDLQIYSLNYAIKNLLTAINSNSDKTLEPILQKLKDLGVIKSWCYNGTYHAC